MRLGVIIITVFKRVKADLPLLITGSLLFYYLFKNELDMLNSHAENELLPHITNDITNLNNNPDSTSLLPIDNKFIENAEEAFKPVVNTDPKTDKSANIMDKSKDTNNVNLLDYETLLEKNRFFPVLQNSFDIKDAFNRLTIKPSDTITNIKSMSRKLKHLLIDKFTWKTSYNYITNDYPNIQSTKFEDYGFSVDAQLDNVKSLFEETFSLYSSVIAGEVDEVKPLSRKRVDNGNGFGRSLIGSIDMLYLLNMEEELDVLIQKLTIEDTLTTNKNLLNTNENFITIVSSLISGYELSNEKHEVFLRLAKKMAKIAIKAYDTPNNGLPLSELPYKSLIQNRFPLRKSSIFAITGNILELIKISSLTKENVYISTGLNVFQKMIESSKNIFNMDYLFPLQVDASCCQLTREESSESINKKTSTSGSQMKSIFYGNYVNCLLRETFFSINDLNNFDFDGEETLEFIDLINEDGNANYLFSILKSYHLLNGNEGLAFKSYFEKSFELMNNFMFFKPMLPEILITKEEMDNAVFFTPITVKRGEFNEDTGNVEVLVTQSLNVKTQHCQLGGMYLYASKLFKNSTYQKVGEQLINGCSLLPKLLNMELIPESVSFDKCIDLNNCGNFNAEVKIQSLSDGSIFDNNFEIVTTGFFSVMEIEKSAKEQSTASSGDDNIDETDEIMQKLKDNQSLIKVNQKRNNNDMENVNLENEVAEEVKDEDASFIFSSDQATESKASVKRTYKMTTSKTELSGKEFDFKKQQWSNTQYPFYINSIDPKYLMRSEYIESLFYAYRITGNNKYRFMAADTLVKMISNVRHVHNKHIEISAIEDLFSLQARDELPYYWFTRTLKYYFLIFSEVSNFSLDDYIFNGDGHIFKKNYIIQK